MKTSLDLPDALLSELMLLTKTKTKRSAIITAITEYKKIGKYNIDSKILLAKTYELISAKGYSIVNIDSTLLLQAPKIKPYVPAMQSCIASILHLSTDAVSIKATTTEELSFIGREEGAVATANVLLVKDL